MQDFAERRRMMVDTQVRPSDVTKFPIIDAMLSVRREDFVPSAAREVAYTGENIALDAQRVVLEPRTLAKMLDLLAVGNADLVLDLGCGLGYSSAVLARMAEAVVAVEVDEALAAEAQAQLSEAGVDNVILHQGDLAVGAPEHGPYDVILAQGGIETLPDAILEQLKDGGRIVCLFMDGQLGLVKHGIKLGGKVDWHTDFSASAPVLPGFEAKPAFTL